MCNYRMMYREALHSGEATWSQTEYMGDEQERRLQRKVKVVDPGVLYTNSSGCQKPLQDDNKSEL